MEVFSRKMTHDLLEEATRAQIHGTLGWQAHVCCVSRPSATERSVQVMEHLLLAPMETVWQLRLEACDEAGSMIV